MSEPITRPLPDDFDPYRLGGVNPDNGSSASVSSHVNSHNNSALPWIALAMLLSGLGLAFGISAYISSRDAINALTLRVESDRSQFETYKREINTNVKLLDNHTQVAINQLDVMEKLRANQSKR